MQSLDNLAITVARDPELRFLEAGDVFGCRQRVAVPGWREDPESREWTEKPSYLDVAVRGRQAEALPDGPAPHFADLLGEGDGKAEAPVSF